MPKHRDLRTTSPVAWVKQLLQQPPGDWPPHWQGFRNVAEAFRELFDEYVREGNHAPPPAELLRYATHDPQRWPDREIWPLADQGRGVVICGGGWRFFPSLYVTVRMLRHVGCALPVQVWYLGNRGEFDARFARALAPFNVGFVDADAEAQKEGRGRRILGGWEMKPFAVAYSPFREVFYLDADAYPVYDPEVFIDDPRVRRIGAAFWPDQNPLKRGQFERFGVEPRREPSFETGQFYVDKSRHWRPLAATMFLNDFSDYVYKQIYGDKDTFHLSWRKCGHDYLMVRQSPGWDTVAFVHHDLDGRPLIVHRTRDKFRFGSGRVDDRPIGEHNWYMTPQWAFSTLNPHDQGRVAEPPAGGCDNLFVPSLPQEEAAHEYLRELERIMRPEGPDGPTAGARAIGGQVAGILDRRRSRRVARVVCTHHRSASQWVRLVVSRALRSAGKSAVGLSFGGGDAPPGSSEHDARPANVRSALDWAGAVINSNACPEFLALLEPYADHRIVHVYRDPRDVVVSSYFAHRSFHPPNLAGMAGHLERLRACGDDLDAGLIEVIDWLGWLWQQLRDWPQLDDDPRALQIPFSRLTREPAASLQQIAAHLDAPIEAAAAKRIVDRLSWSNLAGGRRRGQERADAHFRKGVTGDWRRYWSPAVSRAFEDAAGDLIDRWGDDPERWLT